MSDKEPTAHAKFPFMSAQTQLYLSSSLIGMVRVTLGFPIEHPLDSIKTQWQAKPNFKNEVHIVRHIYHDKGVRGFYSGALPNLTRCIVRNSYKYPLMIGLPNFFKQKIENEGVCKIMTGGTIALTEAMITCPFERLKVFFMTTPPDKQQSYLSFMKSIQGNTFRELFRGFTPLFSR